MKTYRLTKDIVVLENHKHVFFKENTYFREESTGYYTDEFAGDEIGVLGISRENFQVLAEYFEEVPYQEVTLVQALESLSSASLAWIEKLQAQKPKEMETLRELLGVKDAFYLEERIKDLETQLFLKNQTAFWPNGDWTVTATQE